MNFDKRYTHQQFLPLRYDHAEAASDKFDFEKRADVQWGEHAAVIAIAENSHRRIIQAGIHGYFDRMTIPEKIALADLNMRKRGLTGLILGSMAKKLYHAPEDILTVHSSHRDVDVLILQPHSPSHPAPFLHGTDWFVRPHQRPPTNSLIKMWYDLELKADMASVVPETSEQSSISISPDKKFHYLPELPSNPFSIVEEVRGNIGRVELPAGLYLPDHQTIDKIVDHCNARTPFQAFLSIESMYLGVLAKIEAGVRNIPAKEKETKLPTLLMDAVKDIEEIAKKMTQLFRALGDKDADIRLSRTEPSLAMGTTGLSKWITTACAGVGKLLVMLKSRVENSDRKQSYDYLRIDPQDARPLFPVLPDELLKFNPLQQ